MDFILLFLISAIIIILFLIIFKKYNLKEKFDNIQIDPSSIPTFALYQPENSGRHLNFFSHAPKETPYYPNELWRPLVQDPYYQPAYTQYFYNDGYFYPLSQ
jgi:hypothetical protein